MLRKRTDVIKTYKVSQITFGSDIRNFLSKMLVSLPVSQRSPVHPLRQLHVKCVCRSTHIPLLRHGELEHGSGPK